MKRDSTSSECAVVPARPEAPPLKSANPSYHQILKSSALIGGSSVITIALGIIRTKVLAVLLGPSGVGLMGLFNSVIDTANTLVGAGISNSGVRQIADASGSGDSHQLARKVLALRRVVLLLGLMGALILFLARKPVSQLTFGHTGHADSVGWLSAAIFLAVIAGGQAALVQGMRRIKDLAVMGIMGAFLGTAVGIPIIYLLGADGIIPMLLTVAGMTFLTACWQARKIQVESLTMSWTETWSEAIPLLKLGLVFSSAAVMATLVAYCVRVIVVRRFGLESAGIYQAVWTLSSLYVGFILQAMGKDFFPRLTAAGKDNAACNRLVNEQVEISLLLAAPGILATLSLASWVIPMFYSAQFGPAIEILRWQALGMLLRLVSWPMGFLLLAKGENKLFFWTEVISNTAYIALIWAGTKYWGLLGTGIAFFVLYVFYACLMVAIARRLSRFCWTAANRWVGVLVIISTGLVFLLFYVLPDLKASIVGVLLALAMGSYSAKRLYSLAGPQLLASLKRKIRPS